MDAKPTERYVYVLTHAFEYDGDLGVVTYARVTNENPPQVSYGVHHGWELTVELCPKLAIHVKKPNWWDTREEALQELQRRQLARVNKYTKWLAETYQASLAAMLDDAETRWWKTPSSTMREE